MKRPAFHWPVALLGAVLAIAPAFAEEVVDSCASLLGSIGVELRYARHLPQGVRTTFVCPRDTAALVGASRERILKALGTPDASARALEGEGVLAWSYFFGPAPARDQDRDPHQPELSFRFDAAMNVASVDCRQRR